MSSRELADLKERLQSFQFAALKEIIPEDFIRPLRTLIRTIGLHADGTLSCWCEDEIFIQENDQRRISINARLFNKESGELVLIHGSSAVAARSVGQGALLHIRVGDYRYFRK